MIAICDTCHACRAFRDLVWQFTVLRSLAILDACQSFRHLCPVWPALQRYYVVHKSYRLHSGSARSGRHCKMDEVALHALSCPQDYPDDPLQLGWPHRLTTEWQQHNIVESMQEHDACGSGIYDGSCAGPTYEVIRNTNTGAVIGNYSLVYTQLNANTLAASLPSSFNGSQSLTYGNYSAVITYDPTSNFLQPTPLTVLFSITVCSPASVTESTC